MRSSPFRTISLCVGVVFGSLASMLSVAHSIDTQSAPQNPSSSDIEIVSFELQPNLFVERNYIPKSEDDMSNQAAHMAKGFLRSNLTVRNVGKRTAYLVDWEYI